MNRFEKPNEMYSPAETAIPSAAERESLEEYRGLSSAEVRQMIAEGRVNLTKIKSGKSYLRIVLDNILTYFNLIYALVTVVLIAFGSFPNLTYFAIVIPNLLIAIIQEVRAKRTVQRLSVTTDPRATVFRDGIEQDVDAREIVVGDLMKVELGRQVLSDAIVTSGTCEANESMLTGESVPVKKQPGDRILAGSFIVSGVAYARVDRVGADNYVTGIEKQAKAFKAPSSNLFRDLGRIIKVIGIIMIPLSVALFITNWFYYGGRISDFGSVGVVVEKTCGSIIGMIPAGMYLLVTLTLSLSVITLGRKKTLVQDMYSIEMLARADVVCLDKTGTITDGTMEVSGILPLEGTPVSEIERIMSYLQGVDEGINATSRALSARFEPVMGELISRVPFSSARKYSAANIAEIGAYAIGAPHFAPCLITDEVDGMILERAALGERVLVLVRMDESESEGEAIALIALADRIRPSAAETIAKFQAADVAVKVISGDHAATVSTIATRVGIKDADKYLSCESISDEELVAAADDYAVFGRVTPEQKVLLVKALKAKGHTVAMTGDGVNDTLALKEANCAIAMADGSEVARKVSQIVLMNSDFSTLPDVVKEGRRCINNVRQSSTLYLMKTIFTILITLFAIATVSGYPFTPSRFMLLELLIIGLPSVALALEPNNNRIEGSFIERVLIKSLPSALALFIPTLFILIAERAGMGISIAARDSVAMCAVTLVGFVNLIFICRPYTRWRAAVAFMVLGVLAVVVPVFGWIDTCYLGCRFFGFPSAFEDVPFFLSALAASAAVAVLMQLAGNKVQSLVTRIYKRFGRSKK